MTSFFCPQCGAPVTFRSTTVSLVCEYCDSTIVRRDVDIDLLGKVSALVDNGSPILLNSTGRFESVPFEVMGRLQVTYARGTWNEWFLEFADGTTAWLTDAMGRYALVRPKDPSIIADRILEFDKLPLGLIVNIDGVEAKVIDRRAARYQGAEGVLPFDAHPGVVFHGVDLLGFRGEFITLDYGASGDHRRPTPYFGGTVSLDRLGLRPLRAFEGWRPPEPTAGGRR